MFSLISVQPFSVAWLITQHLSHINKTSIIVPAIHYIFLMGEC